MIEQKSLPVRLRACVPCAVCAVCRACVPVCRPPAWYHLFMYVCLAAPVFVRTLRLALKPSGPVVKIDERSGVPLFVGMPIGFAERTADPTRRTILQ
jgi:hypothetical protein